MTPFDFSTDGTRWSGLVVAALALAATAITASAQTTGSVYYVCPGNIFTNTISAKEAETKGCKAREAQQPTSVPAPKPRSPSTGAAPSSAPRPADTRIDSSEQKARDTDARRILETELRKEEEKLESLRREFNNGEPERKGEERNSQKYADRVAEMKAAIQRKEADLAAIRREMGKLGQ